jgi:hypothetical protein
MPRPKKRPDDRRTEKLCAWVTPADHARVVSLADRAGLSLSEYVGMQAVEGRVVVRQHRTLAPDAVLQIQRLGVLFNQLVRLAHERQSIPPEVAQAAATIERILIEQVDGDGAESRR